MKKETPYQRVYSFKRKYAEGFLQSELEELIKEYPEMDMKKFNDVMMCNTCPVVDGHVLSYPHDVSLALNYGLEKKKLTQS